MPKILVIDNYDSFVYNLIHLLKECDSVEIDTMYNDQIDFSCLHKYDTLVLSPGPGLPKQNNRLMDCLQACAGTHRILGVCLGHQAICELFGAKLVQLERIKHGHKAIITKTDNKDVLLQSLPSVFNAALYNSWVVSVGNFPNDLSISSVDESGSIMSVYNNKLAIYGVQFHPESIVSNCGKSIIDAFLKTWISS